MKNIKDRFTFGQYRGLQLQEVFQGTLNISKELIENFLDKILNNKPNYANGFFEIQLIEKFDLNNQKIKLIGQIADETKPLNQNNKLVFGNLEKELSFYVNSFFWKDNNLGILQNIKEYAKSKNIISPIGGDPEYIMWCENNIDEFQLNSKVKRDLEKLKVSRFKGISILYKGTDEYEYREKIEIESYKFCNN